MPVTSRPWIYVCMYRIVCYFTSRVHSMVEQLVVSSCLSSETSFKQKNTDLDSLMIHTCDNHCVNLCTTTSLALLCAFLAYQESQDCPHTKTAKYMGMRLQVKLISQAKDERVCYSYSRRVVKPVSYLENQRLKQRDDSYMWQSTCKFLSSVLGSWYFSSNNC